MITDFLLLPVIKWDIILDDPLRHSSTHPGTKLFGELIRDHMSRFKYYAMDTMAKRELEERIINSTMLYVQNNGRFLVKQFKKFRVVDDYKEVKSKARTWFNLKIGQVPLVGSFVFTQFLERNSGLNEQIIKFLDELYLNEFREPWTPGGGICASIDSAYNKNHQANVHRPTYLRQNFSREHPSIETGDESTVYRSTYGTGSGLSTHGIPKR